MTRRKGEPENFLDQLVYLPWWVSVAVAFMVYIGLGTILPSVFSGSHILRPTAEVISDMAWLISALFLIPAMFSAFRAWRGRRLLSIYYTKEKIRSLDWEEFEELIEAYYSHIGFRVHREGGSGPDGGVDVRITSPSDEIYLVQCKQWRAQRVGVKIVRELYGVVAADRAKGGIVVTVGSFTREAEEFASGIEMELIDGNRLEEMLRELPVEHATDVERDQVSSTEDHQCPRCGEALVLRIAGRGPNVGSNFYGCSSFPRCRFTRPC